ncbi:cellulose biosynthesis protein BcsG [Enterobacter hormaechei]
MSQGSQVAGFSADYMLDLVERFINWQMIGAGICPAGRLAVLSRVDPGDGVCRRDYDWLTS